MNIKKVGFLSTYGKLVLTGVLVIILLYFFLPGILKDQETIDKKKQEKIDAALANSMTIKAATSKHIGVCPYGRMISCQLVFNVEASPYVSPIVGIVNEDIWHAGKIIVPKKTEVHGKTTPNQFNGKIIADREWMLVWRTGDGNNGRQVKITGYALSAKDETDKASWMNEGINGIKGEKVKNEATGETTLKCLGGTNFYLYATDEIK